MKKRFLLVWLLAAMAGALLVAQTVVGPQTGVAPAKPQERIQSFDTSITVAPDGNILVRETIAVQATGEKIHHGIYREFPTHYQDELGNVYTLGFKVVGVKRDGHTEPYHTDQLEDLVRVYFGSPDYLLPPGLHTYEFTYSTNRRLDLFSDHDELYWNVPGGWDFPVDVATATVVLPPEVRKAILQVHAYTGQGERGESFTTARDPEGNPTFRAEHLLPGQGLTIVITWPIGLIPHQGRPPAQVAQAVPPMQYNDPVFLCLIVADRL